MILITLVTTNIVITGKALSRLQSHDFKLYRARQGESCRNSHPARRMHDRGLPCQHGWLCVDMRVQVSSMLATLLAVADAFAAAAKERARGCGACRQTLSPPATATVTLGPLEVAVRGVSVPSYTKQGL